MIPFDITKLTNEHVQLKSLTGALGGSMMIVDSKNSTNDNEVYKRVVIPTAVARLFALKYKITKYVEPVVTSVTKYDGRVVGLERHPLGNIGTDTAEGVFGVVTWKSQSEKNIGEFIQTHTNDGQKWYVDGVNIFKFDKENPTNKLSGNGKFEATPFICIKMAGVSNKKMTVSSKYCVTYITNNGDKYHSPPIWSNMFNIGNKQLVDTVTDDSVLRFDKIDEFLVINIGFVLKAAKDLSPIFGYEVIEPLGLDNLMIQLNTVNLPRLPQSIKRTFNVGLRFTHVVAWLLGLISRTETIEQYITMRSVLKYLTTKGVFSKTALLKRNVYHDGFTVHDVPLYTQEQALNNIRINEHDNL